MVSVATKLGHFSSARAILQTACGFPRNCTGGHARPILCLRPSPVFWPKAGQSEDLGLLLVDTLHCESERVTPLAHLVHEKTAGNPFFVIQFISALAEEGLLTFDHDVGRWAWDVGRIHAIQQLDQLYRHLRDPEPTAGLQGTIGAHVDRLDLATLIKVSQALSGEIILEKLADTLMRTAIEHAGAERGLLILPRGNEHRIECEAATKGDMVIVNLGAAPVTGRALPESIVRYVTRTKESVILDDASVENRFSEDAYLRERQSKSVLCLALMKQGTLTGVLHLENSLAPRVFTSSRLTVLELLASQAAISLDNARLYAELTQENSDRRKAEEALRASEQRLQDIIDHTSAVIFVKDLELNYLLINREFERRHNVRRDEIRGKDDFDILPYEVAKEIRANDCPGHRSRRPDSVRGSGTLEARKSLQSLFEVSSPRPQRQAIRGLWNCDGHHRTHAG